MPSTTPIKSPAGYVPAFAIGYSDADGTLAVVDSLTPLPVALSGSQPVNVTSYTPPAPAPLEGSSALSAVAGPFAPVAGRPVVMTLSGVWAGTVQLRRSTDGGVTRHPVTVGGIAWGRYSANACEPVWEEQESGVQLYLDIALTSGTIAYRIAQ